VDLKKQLAAKSNAPTDERLQQEVRALRQQLNNRQAAATRAADLEAQVWRLTSQLQVRAPSVQFPHVLQVAGHEDVSALAWQTALPI
jgi:macrodomain Ter protein organizer (MatP/YcbG family)